MVERNKKLIERYPFLMPCDWSSGVPSEDFDYSYTILDQMPEGWRIAFGDAMLEELRDILLRHDWLQRYRVYLIKEKFGVMRWHSNAGEDIADEHRAWLEKYVRESSRTCIDCGKPATRITKDYISPYCEECAKRHDKKYKSLPSPEEYYGVAKEVSIAELEAEEKNTDCELLARLTALSEAWKDLKERTEGKRPGVPLVWTVDEDGLLYLDGKWVCPFKYVGADRLAKRELSSLVSDVTIVLPLTEGNMDLIILKEFEEYEFNIVERMV